MKRLFNIDPPPPLMFTPLEVSRDPFAASAAAEAASQSSPGT
jgi:hypothetical protein